MTWGTITSPHTSSSSQFAGDYLNKLSKLFSDIDVSLTPYSSTDIPLINTPFQIRSGKLQLLRSSGSNGCIIVIPAVGSLYNLNVPLISADDTFALLGVANSFTERITVSKDTADLLYLRRPTQTVGNGVEFWSWMYDSANVYKNYGRFRWEIRTNTPGAENSSAKWSVMKAGTITSMLSINGETGLVLLGTNLRQGFDDSLETAARTYQTPNNDAQLIGVVSKSNTTVDINTTAAETDLLNYSVSGNRMGTNGVVKFTITGYILQNQATGTTYTFAIKFGGTTMWADVTASISQSATKFPFLIEGEIYNKNATNAQSLAGKIIINDSTAATTGIGDISTAGLLVNNFDSEGADTTKDTTSAQTLQVTVTMSVSNANVKTVVKHKRVELMT